jgi:hypothetical protein
VDALNVPTKKKSVNTQEKATVRLYLCDDARQEVGGKLTLVGLYPDCVVIVGLLDDEMRGTSGRPEFYSVDALSFVVNVAELTGPHRLTVHYSDSTMPPREPTVREVDFGKDSHKSANIVWHFRPYISNSFGKKRVVVEVDATPHVLEYEIRRGSAPAPSVETKPHLAASTPSPKLSARRKKG